MGGYFNDHDNSVDFFTLLDILLKSYCYEHFLKLRINKTLVSLQLIAMMSGRSYIREAITQAIFFILINRSK